jgi:ElaA protein
VREVKWEWRQLGTMRPEELYGLLALRVSIFVVEQECPYQELDGLDQAAIHLLGNVNGELMACLRMLPPAAEDARVRIGRVAVASTMRAEGMARKMMKLALDRAAARYPDQPVFVSAQTYLRDFYVSLGFAVSGDAYLEDDIPHLPMILKS